MTEHMQQFPQWVMSILVSAMIGLIYVVYVEISSDIGKHNDNAMAILSKIELMAVQSVQTRSDLHAHIEEAKYWKDEITEIRKTVTSLREDASSRKDPFTGTEGEYLRQRVERLEQIVDIISREARDHIQESEKHK